jgi:hypothetical protein
MPSTMADQDKSTEMPGDTGGSYILPGKGTRNARLERRAIMQKWNVRPEALQPMIERQITIATDPEQRPRESTQAFLAVLKARGQDLEIERLENGIPEPKEGGDTFNITQNNLVLLSQAELDALEAVQDKLGRAQLPSPCIPAPNSQSTANGKDDGHPNGEA